MVDNIKEPTSDKILSSRSYNSFFVLTRRFLELVGESSDSVVDLNLAAGIFGVSKRKIYDITNVLEGLGLLVKYSVNNAKWVGPDIKLYFELMSTDDGLKEVANKENVCNENKKINVMEHKNALLDRKLEVLNQEINDISQQENSIANSYVTYRDLYSLPSLRNKLVFAVKAPPETYLEYPKKKDGEDYEIQLSASEGKIDILYISEDNK